jgi:hypothetical protein
MIRRFDVETTGKFVDKFAHAAVLDRWDDSLICGKSDGKCLADGSITMNGTLLHLPAASTS